MCYYCRSTLVRGKAWIGKSSYTEQYFRGLALLIYKYLCLSHVYYSKLCVFIPLLKSHF